VTQKKKREKQHKQSEPSPEPEPEPGEAPSKFKGQKAVRYESDYTVCSLFSPEQIAKEFGVPAGSDVVTIAEAAAEGYRPDFQQAAFEGCLDGMLSQE